MRRKGEGGGGEIAWKELFTCPPEALPRFRTEPFAILLFFLNETFKKVVFLNLENVWLIDNYFYQKFLKSLKLCNQKIKRLNEKLVGHVDSTLVYRSKVRRFESTLLLMSKIQNQIINKYKSKSHTKKKKKKCVYIFIDWKNLKFFFSPRKVFTVNFVART